MTRRTATEVARNLFAVLGRLANANREEIEVVRNGSPIAMIVPPRARLLPGSRFRDVILSAPEIDEDFAGEVERLRNEVGRPEERWPP